MRLMYAKYLDFYMYIYTDNIIEGTIFFLKHIQFTLHLTGLLCSGLAMFAMNAF